VCLAWQTLAACTMCKSLVGSQKWRVAQRDVAHDWQGTRRGRKTIAMLGYIARDGVLLRKSGGSYVIQGDQWLKKKPLERTKFVALERSRWVPKPDVD